jgi:hypothetical protein
MIASIYYDRGIRETRKWIYNWLLPKIEEENNDEKG